MVLMNAASNDAATNPNSPEGSNDSIAGYARSCPTLLASTPGNAARNESSVGNTMTEASAIKIHGHGRNA